MVAKERDHPILANIRESNLAFYFVHSFVMPLQSARAMSSASRNTVSP